MKTVLLLVVMVCYSMAASTYRRSSDDTDEEGEQKRFGMRDDVAIDCASQGYFNCDTISKVHNKLVAAGQMKPGALEAFNQRCQAFVDEQQTQQKRRFNWGKAAQIGGSLLTKFGKREENECGSQGYFNCETISVVHKKLVAAGQMSQGALDAFTEVCQAFENSDKQKRFNWGKAAQIGGHVLSSFGKRQDDDNDQQERFDSETDQEKRFSFGGRIGKRQDDDNDQQERFDPETDQEKRFNWGKAAQIGGHLMSSFGKRDEADCASQGYFNCDTITVVHEQLVAAGQMSPGALEAFNKRCQAFVDEQKNQQKRRFDWGKAAQIGGHVLTQLG